MDEIKIISNCRRIKIFRILYLLDSFPSSLSALNYLHSLTIAIIFLIFQYFDARYTSRVRTRTIHPRRSRLNVIPPSPAFSLSFALTRDSP